ncbi:MAG: RNA methyltransferase [Caldilinea sp.]|nr:RNA methyltransferase [Caldilinea sp.]MDW8442455.1 RNA methyltransferase [Caldilineaceae bacterium]
MTHAVYECSDPACRFRFPAAEAQMRNGRCPWCGEPVILLRHLPTPVERMAPEVDALRSTLPFAAVLDNVRSAFNVGSIFRSADGAGLRHLYLCGVTPTPDHGKVVKTALGAERSVRWSHHRNAVALAHRLRNEGWTLWALETDADAASIFEVEAPPTPFALVVGNEVTGVDPDLLALCERCISIPMAGRKRSLNVATAFGVAAILFGRLLTRSEARRCTHSEQ